jgi:PAS domain S-box-containing protein
MDPRPPREPRPPVYRSLDVTLAGLIAAACATAHASAGAIYLRDAEIGDLRLAAGFNLPPEAIGHRVVPGEGLVGQAVASGRSLVSIDVVLDPRARQVRADWATDPPARGFLGLPLRTGELVIGAIELTSPRPDAFTEDDRRHAAILADAAALLVEQALLTLQPPPAAMEGAALSGDNPMGMLTVSPRLRVTSANPTLCRMLDQPVEMLVGRPALAALPVLGRPRARDAMEAALRGTPAHLGVARTVDRAGKEQDLSLSLIPLGDPSRGVAGIVVIVIDVTERARLEAELREQNARAIEARDRLRAVVEVVSHELRTPLTSVLGYARLLQDRPDAPQERRAHWAGVVIEKARMMARLVDEITDLARLGSARFALRRAPMDLGALLRRVAADTAALSPRHSFDVAVEPGLPEVWLDAGRIEQVLGNLFSNAVKFWPEGGVVSVTARPDPKQDHVEVAVADQGPGVPPDQAERIFEPFQRAGDALTRQIAGSGLGLAVSRGIVEAHSGRIWMEPGPAGGAVFRFTLPVSAPEGEESGETG